MEDSWQIPWGGEGRPERGLGSSGPSAGATKLIELQREEESSTLFVQVHTGSRGFGHGLATNYFAMAKDERHGEIEDIDLGYLAGSRATEATTSTPSPREATSRSSTG